MDANRPPTAPIHQGEISVLVHKGRRMTTVIALAALTVSGATISVIPSAQAPNGGSATLARSPTLSRLTTDADPARTTSSFTLTGTVVDDNGAPAANTNLSINLDPSGPMLTRAAAGGPDAVGFLVAETVTTADGTFTVRIPALKGIEDYIDEDGAAHLYVMGAHDRGFVHHRLELELPTTPGARPVVPFVDDEVMRTRASKTTRAAEGKAPADELVSVTLPLLTDGRSAAGP
jgi:hypothetical protein